MTKQVFLLLVLILSVSSLAAAYTSSDFATPELEQRYWLLAQELRCLVCQNQSLADSNAELAGDLRRALIEQLHSGKSDEQIRSFLVARYGNYVLYDPPLESSTLLLWVSPLIIVFSSFGILWLTIRRYRKQADTPNHQ